MIIVGWPLSPSPQIRQEKERHKESRNKTEAQPRNLLQPLLLHLHRGCLRLRLDLCLCRLHLSSRGLCLGRLMLPAWGDSAPWPGGLSSWRRRPQPASHWAHRNWRTLLSRVGNGAFSPPGTPQRSTYGLSCGGRLYRRRTWELQPGSGERCAPTCYTCRRNRLVAGPPRRCRPHSGIRRVCFCFCFGSFIYNPLHGARGAMAAACHCLLQGSDGLF